jgi:integrase
LRGADIEITDAGPFMHISEDADGATVKTAASVRAAPVHSELVRLGFLDYVAATKATAEESLWPVLRFRKDKPGAYFSDWFGQFRRACAVSVPDFHSLRHTVRTAMTEAGISEAVQDRITGHEVQGSTGTRVYAHPRAVLRKAVEPIAYPTLSLPACYEAGRQREATCS